jgi:hypothetical protein
MASALRLMEVAMRFKFTGFGSDRANGRDVVVLYFKSSTGELRIDIPPDKMGCIFQGALEPLREYDFEVDCQ